MLKLPDGWCGSQSSDDQTLVSLVQGGGADREEVQVLETAVRSVEPCSTREESMEVMELMLLSVELFRTFST